MTETENICSKSDDLNNEIDDASDKLDSLFPRKYSSTVSVILGQVNSKNVYDTSQSVNSDKVISELKCSNEKLVTIQIQNVVPLEDLIDENSVIVKSEDQPFTFTQKEKLKIKSKSFSDKTEIDSERIKHLESSKTFNDDNSYSYMGLEEKNNHSNISDSDDNLKNKSENHQSNVLSQSKKLFMDPKFQRKMNDLYSVSASANINRPSSVKSNIKPTALRMNSNCEIVEENFSPVSETAKQLEHQLSFNSSPKSTKNSPKIPKYTRFARLNKYLNVTQDLEVNDESKDETFLNG